MSTLDNPTPNAEQVSIVPTASRYGLIGGMALIVVAILTYMFLLGSSSSMMLSSAIPFLIYIGIAVMAIKQHRDEELGGYIKLGQCIGIGTLAIIIAVLVSAVFNYIYTTFIDPTVLERSLEIVEEMYADFMDEDQLDEAMEAARANQPGVVMTLVWSLVGGGFFGLIISLIVGAIMKKDPPAML